jgi:hypothetical protein
MNYLRVLAAIALVIAIAILSWYVVYSFVYWLTWGEAP